MMTWTDHETGQDARGYTRRDAYLRKYGEGPIRSGEEGGRRSLWDRKFIGTRWFGPDEFAGLSGPD